MTHLQTRNSYELQKNVLFFIAKTKNKYTFVALSVLSSRFLLVLEKDHLTSLKLQVDRFKSLNICRIIKRYNIIIIFKRNKSLN